MCKSWPAQREFQSRALGYVPRPVLIVSPLHRRDTTDPNDHEEERNGERSRRAEQANFYTCKQVKAVWHRRNPEVCKCATNSMIACPTTVLTCRGRCNDLDRGKGRRLTRPSL